MKMWQFWWDFIQTVLRFWKPLIIRDPENRVVIITGCDSGFGLLSTYRLLALRYYVVPLCLREQSVKEITEYAKTNGYSRCLPLRCDMTCEKDVQKVYDTVENLLSSDTKLKLWAIINNAGIAFSGYVDWLPIEVYRKIMEVNFFSIVSFTKLFVQLLKRTKGSRIINISSMAGLTGYPGLSAYAASKHALEGFSKCLRAELVPWNIQVVNINPGYMKTPILEKWNDDVLAIWENSPSDIKEQYTSENISRLSDQSKMGDDPNLVIQAIIQQITSDLSYFNIFPGYYAQSIMRSVWYMPRILSHVLQFLGLRNFGFGPRPEVVEKLQGKSV